MNQLPAVGFIGLGIMGKPMARNIQQAGYPLSVYNRTQAKMEEFIQSGAKPCRNFSELTEDCAVIITMLPDSGEVTEVILGEQNLYPHLRSSTTVIDMSSIAPAVSQEVARRLEEKGIDFLDAPVSGGEMGAKEATLAIMVGGKEAVFRRHLPLLQTMGKNIVHVGPAGSGNLTKLVNQIIVALNIATIAEAFVLAQKAGLDCDRVFQAIRGGLAGSRILETKLPNILSEQFQPGFKLRLHRKDLKNTLETAAQLGVPLVLTSLVQQMITSLCQAGEGELDHAALVHFFEQISDTKIRYNF